MTLEEAIKHCLEVAEDNDLAAGTYDLLAENNHNLYEKLTAESNSKRCTEFAGFNRQLAEWLTELKEAKKLLALAVEDFQSLGRGDGKCKMPAMDCDICPLNWDSIDDSIEPCHSWKYTADVMKLLNQ